MSYEGYEQYLCKNGHAWDLDASYIGMEDEPYNSVCPRCGETNVWWNSVDTTNGSFDGIDRIDGYVELELLTSAVVCVCTCCGNRHEDTPATYKLPDKSIGRHKHNSKESK